MTSEDIKHQLINHDRYEVTRYGIRKTESVLTLHACVSEFLLLNVHGVNHAMRYLTFVKAGREASGDFSENELAWNGYLRSARCQPLAGEFLLLNIHGGHHAIRYLTFVKAGRDASGDFSENQLAWNEYLRSARCQPVAGERDSYM